MHIAPLHPLLAAEATDVDLATLDDAGFEALKTAFETHSVLVLRDQQISPAVQIAFSRRLGELEIHVLSQFLLPGAPEILLVSNEKRDGKNIGLADAGHYWHSDLSYLAEPSLGSALHAQVLPRDGGDTLFASQHAAYDGLPEAIKAQIEHLDAEHSYAFRMDILTASGTRAPLTDAQRAAVPPVVHPVVRVHPATGRRALFVSEGFTSRILGVSEEESRRLLDILFAATKAQEVTYRHKWQPHDMVLWDNRAVQHLATGCPPDQARTMYRTTIRGDRPKGPSAV